VEISVYLENFPDMHSPFLYHATKGIDLQEENLFWVNMPHRYQ